MLEEPDMALFRRLDSLDRAPVELLGAGEHLLAVYGDNFMSKTKYKLRSLEPMLKHLTGKHEIESLNQF